MQIVGLNRFLEIEVFLQANKIKENAKSRGAELNYWDLILREISCIGSFEHVDYPH